MSRFLPRLYPGICLLVPLLTIGCQHNRPRCSPCCAPMVEMGAPTAVPAMQDATASTPSGEPVLPAINTRSPTIHTAGKLARPSASDPLLSQAPPSQRSAAAPSAAVQSLPPVLPAAAADESASARPRFAHDPNYHWLVGTLEYSRIQQAWLLRYVSFEEEDRYGGCVTLLASSRSMAFKPGQRVRVEGALIDPESSQLRPAFEVKNVRAE